MRADLVHPGDLGPAEAARWRALQIGDVRFASPYLGPSFARVVGEVRGDARVAVLDGGAGFFGFHAGRAGIGLPLGRTLADYQAVVAAPSLEWAPRALVRACRLRSYAFDHMLAAQGEWAPYVRGADSSPVVDLTRFDPEADMPAEPGRKARRLERAGDPRFVWSEPDPRALATLVRWKRGQYLATGVYDIFEHPWVGRLVERLHAADDADLSGVLACLYDADQLIAAHLLLRSGPALHSWIPAYDPDRSKQSPGLVLLRAILLEAASHGVETLDFGKGSEAYKQSFANAAIAITNGSVQAEASSAALARAGRLAADLVNRTRFNGHAYRARRRLSVGD